MVCAVVLDDDAVLRRELGDSFAEFDRVVAEMCGTEPVGPAEPPEVTELRGQVLELTRALEASQRAHGETQKELDRRRAKQADLETKGARCDELCARVDALNKQVKWYQVRAGES